MFEKQPSEMIRIFQVAIALTSRCRSGRWRCWASWPPRAARRCAPIPIRRPLLHGDRSCDDRDTRNPSLLEQMHDLGLLAAVMPEFAPCTGRVQHDLYHVFTVDQHQMYAVGRLKALARGELADGALDADAGARRGAAARAALPRHAAPRRRQAARQGPLGDRRQARRRHRHALRLVGGGRVADRVPREQAPAALAPVAAARSQRRRHAGQPRAGAQRRGDAARAVPSDGRRHVDGRAGQPDRVEGAAPARALRAHDGVLPPRRRPRRPEQTAVVVERRRSAWPSRSGEPGGTRWSRCSRRCPIATSPRRSRARWCAI